MTSTPTPQSRLVQRVLEAYARQLPVSEMTQELGLTRYVIVDVLRRKGLPHTNAKRGLPYKSPKVPAEVRAEVIRLFLDEGLSQTAVSQRLALTRGQIAGILHRSRSVRSEGAKRVSLHAPAKAKAEPKKRLRESGVSPTYPRVHKTPTRAYSKPTTTPFVMRDVFVPAKIVKFMDLQTTTCRWPLLCGLNCDVPGGVYCGAATQIGHSYCSAHRALSLRVRVE
jgi:hypothetical protein